MHGSQQQPDDSSCAPALRVVVAVHDRGRQDETWPDAVLQKEPGEPGRGGQEVHMLLLGRRKRPEGRLGLELGPEQVLGMRMPEELWPSGVFGQHTFPLPP